MFIGIEKRSKGLTLVETLAVIVVIGLVLYFSVVRLESLTMSVNKDVVESDIRVVKAGITQFYLDKNRLPINEEEIRSAIGIEVKRIGEMDGVVKYQTEKKRDTWNNRYLIYVYVGDDTNYPYFSFISLGPDGQKAPSIDDSEDDLIYIFYPVR